MINTLGWSDVPMDSIELLVCKNDILLHALLKCGITSDDNVVVIIFRTKESVRVSAIRNLACHNVYIQTHTNVQICAMFIIYRRVCVMMMVMTFVNFYLFG